MSISQILRKLFGEIRPIGETYEDGKRYKNIENYYEALCFIIAELQNCADIKSNAYSVNKISQECKSILEEYGIEV